MLNFLKIIDNLYLKYEKTPYILDKIALVSKINKLEDIILKKIRSEREILVCYIIENYYSKSDFIKGRYFYFLSKIDISEPFVDKILEIAVNILYNEKLSSIKRDFITFVIKTLRNMKDKNFENYVFELSKYKIFNLYKNEFIILLGETNSTIKSINFLKELNKKDYEKEDIIYWSIGMICRYNRKNLIKRVLLNDYLKFKLRVLRNKEKEPSVFFYFMLIEILLNNYGINGYLINDILSLVHNRKENSIYKDILVKILNNIELILAEKEEILKIEMTY